MKIYSLQIERASTNGTSNLCKTEIAPLMIMAKLQEFDYASATSIALVMLLISFVILFINALIQSHTSKIVSGID